MSKTDAREKTFSLTIGGAPQHLISYYKVEDIGQGCLIRSPSSFPELASLNISPGCPNKTSPEKSK
ncbi:hypothetical protein OG21DRAFT_574540 [Imleria badia]|nr:hypothetical protein OG21DRAFT_574540 [Imleria badia]